MSRILLVRHGRSAIEWDGRWLRAHEVSHYEDAYDAVGIRDDDEPPEALRAEAQSSILAASDLARAMASVRRLGGDREVQTTPLLREIRLEPPLWLPLRLPITAWDVMSDLQWRYRFLTNAENDFVRRGRDAAEWLARLASADDVLAVTHGGFRRIVTRALEARGWVPTGDGRRYHNWSVWSLSSPSRS